MIQRPASRGSSEMLMRHVRFPLEKARLCPALYHLCGVCYHQMTSCRYADRLTYKQRIYHNEFASRDTTARFILGWIKESAVDKNLRDLPPELTFGVLIKRPPIKDSRESKNDSISL